MTALKCGDEISKSLGEITYWLNRSSCLLALFFRVYLAKILFHSGWLSLHGWQSTLYLYNHEFDVPLISPVIAAYLGTGAELILPVFLVLGLGTRLVAFLALILNLTMVVSNPVLLTEAGVCALKDHYIWGLMLLSLIFYGGGRISMDYYLAYKKTKRIKKR